MEGFITRRGGGAAAGGSSVLSTTFKGNGKNTITLPELIGCKCFAIARGVSALPLSGENDCVLSLAYMNGKTVGTYTTYNYYAANGTKTTDITKYEDGDTFDPATGTITAAKEFKAVTYNLVAYF